MTIGEIIDGLNRREPIAIIAKRLEISPYTLSKKLRLIGYEYDGEQKKRIFVGDGEEPRHLQLQEATALQYEKTDYQLLIYEQLQSIYELLRKREEVIVPIMSKSTEKKRRTFSINTEILSQFLISESKGVQKSKLVEEALHQFLQQYEVDKTSHFDN